MIVVDASVIIDLLLNIGAAEKIRSFLEKAKDEWAAPELLDVEVLSVLRRYSLSKDLSPNRGLEALSDLEALPIQRFTHSILLPGIWDLRDRIGAYDAAYVTLASLLDAPLLTRDKKLASQAKSKLKQVQLF